MSSARKIRRKKEQAKRKKNNKILKEVSKSIETMPKICSKCGVHFDKTIPENLDKWGIQIYETGRVTLTCGICRTAETEKTTSE